MYDVSGDCLCDAVILFVPFLFQGLGTRFVEETGMLTASVIVGAVQVKLFL